MIAQNLRLVLDRIAAAARRAGRDPSLVSVTAVSKYASPEETAEALRTGLIAHLGENRVQDAARKFAALDACAPPLPPFARRLTGHLQRNKAQEAVRLFDAVDSLDSPRLAQALESRLDEIGKSLPVLVQVKLSSRQEQSGVPPEELAQFLESLRGFGRLQVRGLMAIAPALEPVEAVRPYFRRMKELFDRHFPGGGGQNVLSMGMSRDFEPAVEEGATMVRLGSAIFGPGSPAPPAD